VLSVSSAALLVAVGFTVQSEQCKIGVMEENVVEVGTGGTISATGGVADSARQLECNDGSVGCTHRAMGRQGWLIQCRSLNDRAGVPGMGSGKKSARGCCNVRWLGPSSKMTFCVLMTAPITESKSL